MARSIRDTDNRNVDIPEGQTSEEAGEELRLDARSLIENREKSKAQENRITALRQSLAEALSEIASLRGRSELAEEQLRSVTESPAWRAVTAYRNWLKYHRDKHPHFFKVYERTLGRVLAGYHTKPLNKEIARPVGTSEAILSSLPLLASKVREPATNNPEYQLWIEQNEPDSTQIDKQRSLSRGLGYRPLISVIVPVYRPAPSFLSDCVASVLGQTYDNWELCIAHGGPHIQENSDYLKQTAARDARVKLIELDANLGISGNTNAALSAASGEFAAFLDHDDTLAPFALFSLAQCLNDHFDADLIYSDHDYLALGTSVRINPLFKPDWSPETMLSSCYITHLTVCRRTLVDSVGGCDPATDGAQDWDLFLKITNLTTRILHIPEVLYHWRVHSGSTALASSHDNPKRYAFSAQEVAIKRHMDRIGMAAEPLARPDGLLSVRWLNPLTHKISIIIPTKDKCGLLSKCLSSLFAKTRYRNYEILLIDTGSQEPETHRYYETLGKYENVTIHHFPQPFNYSAANNFGASHATGDLLLFLNNDVEIVEEAWLEELGQWSLNDSVGIVGAKLLRPDGKLQHAGVVLGLGGFADHPFAGQEPLHFGIAGSTGWYRNWLAVTGACMMIRRDVFEKIGRFDETFILCGSDVEICLRAWQSGYRVVWTPFATLIHHERQTRGHQIPRSDFFVSERSYSQYISKGDPYWNGNLSLWNPQGSFRVAGEQTSREFITSYMRNLGPEPATAIEISPVQVPHATVVREPTEEENIVSWFDYSENDVSVLQGIWLSASGPREIKRIVWFIPSFDIAHYGGIYTILSFADHWRRTHQVTNIFAVCGSTSAEIMAERIGKVYKGCREADVIVLANPSEVPRLPPSDACIATLWTTVFYALRYHRTSRHFYFIQDYEPAFYRAGSSSAIAASTYMLGFYGIANTISLRKTYEEEYGGVATHFTPCVNPAVFNAIGRKEVSGTSWKVFVYARPQHPRNSFELISAAIRLLKARLGDRVNIVTAGAEWSVGDYNLNGVVQHLGLLPYEETAALYRTCDVGVALMFTRHPSYLPFEFMASGSLVVTNHNAWNNWLFQDSVNCLLSRPTTSCLADTIEKGLRDMDLRARITSVASEMISRNHSDWSREMERVYRFLCDPASEEPLPYSALLSSRIIARVAQA